MKKLLFLFIIASVLFSLLFLGCDAFMPPDITESVPDINDYYTERKDVLALKHLQVTSIDEDTLASYVMSFLNVNTATEGSRSVQPSPVVITKSKEIIHEVETGFAETTADKRPERAVIGPGQIPFYVFTLENQQTGQTGFALTCGDNRIGAVLAVVENGRYDADIPQLGVFYSQLNDYILNTIGVYNNINEADIENALRKNEARASSTYIPITDVGSYRDFILVSSINDDSKNNEKYILETKWSQGTPYNDYLNEKKILGNVFKGYNYKTGCGPVAIAQIMAFHGKPEKSVLLDSHVYDWAAMMEGTDNYSIGKLMYEIGLYAKTLFILGSDGSKDNDDKKDAAGATTRSGIKYGLVNLGYEDPGSFKSYNFEQVKSSIREGYPVIADGSTTGTFLFGVTISTPMGGHYWVIDGYRQMGTNVKRDKGSIIDFETNDYVHCNMGWKDGHANGWYISGVFNTKNIPYEDKNGTLPRSATEAGFYQYGLGILTGIRYIE